MRKQTIFAFRFSDEQYAVLKSCGYSPSAIHIAEKRGGWCKKRMELLALAVKGWRKR